MLVSSGPDCYDATVQLLADGMIEQILIVDKRPRRSVVLGAASKYEDIVAGELAARGVRPEQYRVINTDASTSHDLILESDSVIADEKDSNCLVISAAIRSRYFRKIIDQSLPQQRAARYRVRAITTGNVQASNWWRSRGGVRKVMSNGLRLIFVACIGKSEVDPEDPYQHVVSRAATT